jgi:hypothetical protein
MLLITIIILIFLLFIYFYNNKIKITSVTSKTKNDFKKDLKIFENKMSHWYPLNDKEKFRIDHGPNYFAFFDRMGKTYMQLAIDKSTSNIVGTGCGVLRKIPFNCQAWYICDLKIQKEYRNKWIPWKMLINNISLVGITNKAYGVSMNNGTPNKIVEFIQKMTYPIKFSYAGNLIIYSLDFDRMKKIIKIIELFKGGTFFVSLKNQKDLIMQSNNNKMKLLHLNYNKYDKYTDKTYNTIVDEPDVDSIHMFCLHEKDPLVQHLSNLGITSDSNASIVHHGLDFIKPTGWNFIQTSEI